MRTHKNRHTHGHSFKRGEVLLSFVFSLLVALLLQASLLASTTAQYVGAANSDKRLLVVVGGEQSLDDRLRCETLRSVRMSLEAVLRLGYPQWYLDAFYTWRSPPL